MFETFLEIGVSELLVLTQRLQDSLYGTMRNILILKYWARKAKFHDISRYLADHVSCRVTRERAWIYLIGFSVFQLLITLASDHNFGLTLAFDTKMK